MVPTANAVGTIFYKLIFSVNFHPRRNAVDTDTMRRKLRRQLTGHTF